MIWRYYLAIGMLFAVPNILYSEEYLTSWDGRVYSPTASNVYVHLSSNTYSEVMAIDALINDFSGPLESGSVATTYNIAETGISYEGWRFARILRYDYSLKFSEDTAKLNFQIERGGGAAIDQSQAYDIYLQADHIRSKGFLVGKTFSVNFKLPIIFDIELSWMESSQYYEGSIDVHINQGQLNDQILRDFENDLKIYADNSFSQFSELVEAGQMAQVQANELRALIESSLLEAGVDYSYYKPALREARLDGYQALDAKGSGFALSLQLFVALNDRWSLNLDVRDIYSRIGWKNAGRTRANIRATEGALAALDIVDLYLQEDVIKRFSGDDFKPLNPENPSDPAAALPGIREQLSSEYLDYVVSKGSFTQTLPIRTTLHTEYQINSWFSGFVTYHLNPVMNNYSLGGRLFEYISFSLEPKTQGLGLGFSHPYFSFFIRSDAVSIEDAKRLSFMGSARIPW